MPKPTSLWDLIVREDRQHPTYRMVREGRGYAPARQAMDAAFASFEDTDGNFVQQFQTSGFDSRTWELYLSAYFAAAHGALARPSPSPDFELRRGTDRAFIEAVTSNAAEPQTQPFVWPPATMTEEEVRDYQRHVLPIRVGSPLYSKLNKRYWELDHVAGHPLVIAIECFHEQRALAFADAALHSYLYGRDWSAHRDAQGRLVVTSEAIPDHRLGSKVVPSGFFNLPGAEHVSAVVFSNSGTVSKFQRMACQDGSWRRSIRVRRLGTSFVHDQNASRPGVFQYEVGHPDAPPESWGQGLSVAHNPRALRPIHPRWFPDAAHHVLRDDGLVQSIHVPQFHPLASWTQIFAFPEGFDALSGSGGLGTDSA